MAGYQTTMNINSETHDEIIVANALFNPELSRGKYVKHIHEFYVTEMKQLKSESEKRNTAVSQIADEMSDFLNTINLKTGNYREAMRIWIKRIRALK